MTKQQEQQQQPPQKKAHKKRKRKRNRNRNRNIKDELIKLHPWSEWKQDDIVASVAVGGVVSAVNWLFCTPWLCHQQEESQVGCHSCKFQSWNHLDHGKIVDLQIYHLLPLSSVCSGSPFPSVYFPLLPCFHTKKERKGKEMKTNRASN